jgi:hypothetical protein
VLADLVESQLPGLLLLEQLLLLLFCRPASLLQTGQLIHQSLLIALFPFPAVLCSYLNIAVKMALIFGKNTEGIKRRK